MSCTGCNDGCFDESVQLAQGPAGPAGSAASAELLKVTTASDTVEIGTGAGFSASVEVGYLRTLLETDVTERAQTGNAYSAFHVNKAIAANTLVNNGEILRLNFSIIGDQSRETTGTSPSTGDFYDYKIIFGGATVLDTSAGGNAIYRLSKDTVYGYNACTVSVDLVKTSGTQVTPVIKFDYSSGKRISRLAYEDASKSMEFDRPKFVVLSPVTCGDLSSGTLNLQLQTKSTNGTSNVGVQYHEVIKFIREA